MLFSAAKLVKCSARQIYFFNNNKDKSKNKPTKNQIIGDKLARKKSFGGLREMRGIYRTNSHTIFYCFDEILDKESITYLIEHKSIIGLAKDWYFDSSVAQVALYHSLAVLNPYQKYITASFVDEKERQCFKITKPICSILEFGGKKFRIRVSNPQKVLDFYLRKAEAVRSYDTAFEWDYQWKNKESNYIGKFLRFDRA